MHREKDAIVVIVYGLLGQGAPYTANSTPGGGRGTRGVMEEGGGGRPLSGGSSGRPMGSIAYSGGR